MLSAPTSTSEAAASPDRDVGWLTLVAATADGRKHEDFREQLRGAGWIVADSELLDAGSGRGSLLALEREAWKEARRLLAGQPETHVLRVWDEIVRTYDEESNDLYVSLVANPDAAALDFDDPAVAGAERATLAAFLPHVGTSFIAMSTLMNDWFHCSGAITVFRAASQVEAASLAASDPWRALGPHRLYRLRRAVFRRVQPPPGPNTQRYGAANPWPGGSFAG